MQNSHATYGPPQLPERWLKAALLDAYPSHHNTRNFLFDLVEEYKRFWRLILNYPHRRVVAPGPVMAVQRIHQSDAQLYFNDCMEYFRRFMRRDDLAWRGHTDHVGTFDTIVVYQDMFKTDLPVAWIDMAHLAQMPYGSVKLLR
jgi:hypothetical protein